MGLTWTPRAFLLLLLFGGSADAQADEEQSFLEKVEQRTGEAIGTPIGKPQGYLGLRADDFGQEGPGVRVTLLHAGGAAEPWPK